jgi:hypothetical protein
MNSRIAKGLCLTAFILVGAGCSGREDGESGTSQIPSDDPVSSGGPIVIEVPVGTDTSNEDATPVAPVSSFQMDVFVKNPLLTEIPSELRSSETAGRSYTANPLIN